MVLIGAYVNMAFTVKTTKADKDLCPGDMWVTSSPEMFEDVPCVTEGGAGTKESNTGLTVHLEGKANAN